MDEETRRAVKREYFNKVKSRKFWDEMVTDDADSLAYAKEVYHILHNALAATRTPEQLALVKKAQEELVVDGELEIDDDAIVSAPDGDDAKGAYVMAWVWVDK